MLLRNINGPAFPIREDPTRYLVWLLLHGPGSAYQPQVVIADELDADAGLRDALARYDSKRALQQAIRFCAGRDPGGLA